jgi:transposase
VAEEHKLNLDPNQAVFVGIDVHKKNWAACAIHQGVVIKHASIPGDYIALDGFLSHFQGCQIKTVYEAGFSGFHLHRHLIKNKIDSIVVSPTKIPRAYGDAVKTDKIDAQQLAQLLSVQMLKGIYVPDQAAIDSRQLLRTRQQLKRQRQRSINYIKGLLLQYNLGLNTGLPKATRTMILNLELPESIKVVLKIYIEQYEFFDAKIKTLEKLVHKECMKETWYSNYMILKSVPGIGPLVAATLIFEIDDWNRFTSAKKLSAFIGLTPREYSSGEHTRRGSITGQGNSALRSLLVESCWVIIRKDPTMRAFYERIKLNSGNAKKAITAVARKLLTIVHSLIKQQTVYVLAK